MAQAGGPRREPLRHSSALQSLERDAHGVADRLPDLLVEAKRISSTVTHGIHGRRRAGPGETRPAFGETTRPPANLVLLKGRARPPLEFFPRKRTAHFPCFYRRYLSARCVCRAVLLPCPRMANLHDDPAALQALQDDIYRERILRARKRTVPERLADVFELSNHPFGMMPGGAMYRLGTRDEAAGWREVKRWMQRLDRVRELGF